MSADLDMAELEDAAEEEFRSGLQACLDFAHQAASDLPAYELRRPLDQECQSLLEELVS